MSIASREHRGSKEIICFVAINTHGGYMCSVNHYGISRPDSFTLDRQTDLHIFSNTPVGNVNFAYRGKNYQESLIPLINYIKNGDEINLKGLKNILSRRKTNAKQEISINSHTQMSDWDESTKEFMKNDYLYYEYVAPLNSVSNKLYTYGENEETAIYLLSTFTKYKDQDGYSMEIRNEDITPKLKFTDNAIKSITLSRIIDNVKHILEIKERSDKLTIIFIDDSCDTLFSTKSSKHISKREHRSLTRDSKTRISDKSSDNTANELFKEVILASRKRKREVSLGGAKKYKKRKTQKMRRKRYL
jgi:hypothetical protein